MSTGSPPPFSALDCSRYWGADLVGYRLESCSCASVRAAKHVVTAAAIRPTQIAVFVGSAEPRRRGSPAALDAEIIPTSKGVPARQAYALPGVPRRHGSREPMILSNLAATRSSASRFGIS